jgi:hypothetical protein
MIERVRRSSTIDILAASDFPSGGGTRARRAGSAPTRFLSGVMAVGSLDPVENSTVVHRHEAAINAIVELFTGDEAVANLAGNSPHWSAGWSED